MTDIVLDTGTDKIKASDGVKIQILDDHGYMDTDFIYHKGDTTKGYTKDGWYRGKNLVTKGSANDYFFKSGEGIWFGGKDTYTFQTAGEVRKTPLLVDLITGSKLVANPYPCETKLTSWIVDVGTDKVKASDNVKIQLLDEHGYMTLDYIYHKGDTTKGYTTDGWYRGKNRVTSSNDLIVAPGQSVWFSGKAGYTVTIPVPETIANME